MPPKADPRTIPTLRAVAALAEEGISVSSALSELLDNSFGEARGNARRVTIFYDPRSHKLGVLDDGRGIDRLADLFQLGSAHHTSAHDIGWYGFGGTKALMRMGRPIAVYALRNGRVAWCSVDWQAQIDRNEWPDVPTRWVKATVANCPTQLLTQGHGTLIAMVLRPGIAVREDNVRRDLSKTYGPGLRTDREIIWHNLQGQPIRLTDPVETMADAIHVNIEFEYESVLLRASGLVGYNPQVAIAESRINIGFEFRRLFPTKAPFKGYNGKGILGAIDLAPGWQSYLSTLKDGINHAGVEKRLMEEIHRQILPLLRRIQEQDELILFEDLGDFLADFVGRVKREPDPEGDEEIPATSEEGEPGPPHPAPELLPPFERPKIRARRKLPRGIEISKSTDAQMNGLLCRIESRGETIIAYVNAEHQWIKDALAQTPPNRAALAYCIAKQMAPLVLEKFTENLLKRATAEQLAHYHRLDPHTDRGEREDLAVRILVDRWITSQAAA